MPFLAVTTTIGEPPVGNKSPSKQDTIGTAIKRDPAVTLWIKTLYSDICQFCATVITTPTSTYSHGAHIRGLGSPHDGPDTVNNMLCLCPNCHVRFDFGALYLNGDGRTVVDAVDGTKTQLSQHADHILDAECIAYHRFHIAGISQK